MHTPSLPIAARAAVGAHDSISLSEIRSTRRERVLVVVAGALCAIATPVVLVGAAAVTMS